MEVMDKEQDSLAPLLQLGTPLVSECFGPIFAACAEQIDFETLMEELAEVIEQEGGVLIP